MIQSHLLTKVREMLCGHRKIKESIWSGTIEDAFFDQDSFDRNRILKQPEYEYSGRSSKGSFYTIAVDVGRRGCDSVATVIKSTPQPTGTYLKTVVNLFVMSDMHFEDQAIYLKKLYYKFQARRLVIDGNGLGIGLVDYLVKTQIDQNTGMTLPDFGIFNDRDNEYKRFETTNCETDAVYIVKANAPLNTEAYATLQAQMQAGRIKFLIDERVAKTKLLGTVKGQKMTSEERAEYLKPFTLTSILAEEILNLKEEHEGVNIILKRANSTIKKDKFSSLLYGIYYIKQEEEDKKKKKFNVKDYCFLN